MKKRLEENKLNNWKSKPSGMNIAIISKYILMRWYVWRQR